MTDLASSATTSRVADSDPLGGRPSEDVGRRTRAADRTRDRTRSVLGALLGVGVLGAVWTLLSARQPELVLPSPAETWTSFTGLLGDGALFEELTRTVSRALSGVALALGIGLAWGAAVGRSSWASSISRPVLSTLMALPPVVVVVLGLVWFGPGVGAVRLVIVMVALPLIVIAVGEAVRNLDSDLLEMAQSFQLPRSTTLRHVIAPGIASPVLAATSVTVGQALRVAVMAELLAAADGVGAQVALSRANLATADLFAWAILLIAAVTVVDVLVLRPLTAHLLRWRT